VKGLNYRPPSDSTGQFFPWLNDLRASSGAYVIRRSDNGEVLYVGESHTGQLARTIKRHFYAWQDTADRKHHTYQKGRVEIAVRVTPPGPAAIGAQNNLIRRLNPRDNGTNPAANPF
jgi:excinuclease UvrABC nuclease subunit